MLNYQEYRIKTEKVVNSLPLMYALNDKQKEKLGLSEYKEIYLNFPIGTGKPFLSTSDYEVIQFVELHEAFKL